MASRLSVSEILKAARSGSPGPAIDSAAAPKSPPAEKKIPKPKPKPSASEGAPKMSGLPKPIGGVMSVKDKIAAARAGGSNVASPKPVSSVSENEPKIEPRTKPVVTVKRTETEARKDSEPAGRPASLPAILVAGFIGFAALTALVYVLLGPAILELIPMPTAKSRPSVSVSEVH